MPAGPCAWCRGSAVRSRPPRALPEALPAFHACGKVLAGGNDVELKAGLPLRQRRQLPLAAPACIRVNVQPVALGHHQACANPRRRADAGTGVVSCCSRFLHVRRQQTRAPSQHSRSPRESTCRSKALSCNIDADARLVSDSVRAAAPSSARGGRGSGAGVGEGVTAQRPRDPPGQPDPTDEMRGSIFGGPRSTSSTHPLPGWNSCRKAHERPDAEAPRTTKKYTLCECGADGGRWGYVLNTRFEGLPD